MRNTTHSKHPSSARRRRENHLERDAAIKARKRERKNRGRIHTAMAEAVQLIELSAIPTTLSAQVKATDKKVTGKGWLIVSEPIGNNKSFAVLYEGSRDKARARARAHNDSTSPITIGGEPITHDTAMLKLGWKRVVENRCDGGLKYTPIDEKFVWVGVPS